MVFTIVLLGFHLVGLILKCVYYRYLHMWAWLIMDYVVKEVHEEGSGHWQCTLISNMFFCGKLRERNLTLCCIPGPIFRIFKFFFGEKTWCGGQSCSLCSAVVGLLLLAFVFLVAVIIFFMPVFVIFILPILVITKCRRKNKSENVKKISEDDGTLATADTFLLSETVSPAITLTCNPDPCSPPEDQD